MTGGFSLAAHWLGWQTIAFCERDEFCQKVLRKNFGQDIYIHDDITTFSAESFRGRCDIITGGFPCQPFSQAGKREGRNDDRYLWDETLRVVSEAKPAWFVGENVDGIASMVFDVSEFDVESVRTSRNSEADLFEKIFTQQEIMQLETCCQDLEKEGYEVQPIVIPACAVNAPHRRNRVWIIAHSNSFGRFDEQKENGQIIQDKKRLIEASEYERNNEQRGLNKSNSTSYAVADTNIEGLSLTGLKPRKQKIPTSNGIEHGNCIAADSIRKQKRGKQQIQLKKQERIEFSGNYSDIIANSDERIFGSIAQQTEREFRHENSEYVADSDSQRLQGRGNDLRSERAQSDDKQSFGCDRNWNESWIQVAAEFCRVDARVSNRVDRLRSLGNSIVPQIAFEIFKAIEQAEREINDVKKS